MEDQFVVSRQYAGFWRRLTAFIIDGVVLFILYLPAPLVSQALIYPILKPTVLQDPSSSMWHLGLGVQSQVSVALSVFLMSVVAGLILILWVGYFAILTTKKGGTIGKLILHLRVVNVHGNRISMETALLRHTIGYMISSLAGLGFLWIALDKHKQGWHDKLAQTFVVREGQTRNLDTAMQQ